MSTTPITIEGKDRLAVNLYGTLDVTQAFLPATHAVAASAAGG
jgi:hypothetical protein